tara:strand:+ start:1683 stop:2546 length:864 start_codon:yes stop_codon:yes gene_type:complete
MKSLELTKPVTTESLLKEFESRFNQTMDLSKFSKEELEDTANHVRTKIHEITQNTHFGHELKDDNYQKNQMMLDIINQEISQRKLGEYGGSMASDPQARAGATAISAKSKLDKGQTLSPDEKKQVSKMLQTEGIEEQSELILAAKDMMDKVTGYLEDLASMKTEGMLELADRIRDEMGADKADAFMQKIQPAIEQAEATLTTTRQELDNGVRILTGEEVASEPMGADDTMDMDTDLDSLDSEAGEEDDEFGASDAEAGGTEPEGREQRESKEVFEASNRLYSKLAGK